MTCAHRKTILLVGTLPLLGFTGEMLMVAPASEGIDLCAVEAFCFLLREAVHWKEVCKATPYLEGKPKGDKSMAV
jgi:hypothetical protein